jgi:hypothetical protein
MRHLGHRWGNPDQQNFAVSQDGFFSARSPDQTRDGGPSRSYGHTDSRISIEDEISPVFHRLDDDRVTALLAARIGCRHELYGIRNAVWPRSRLNEARNRKKDGVYGVEVPVGRVRKGTRGGSNVRSYLYSRDLAMVLRYFDDNLVHGVLR